MIPNHERHQCEAEIRGGVLSSVGGKLNNSAKNKNNEAAHITKDDQNDERWTVSIACPRLVKQLDAYEGEQNESPKWEEDEPAPVIL